MLERTETDAVEFKTSWQTPHLAWVCGLANAEGGVLYVGVDDGGNVVGLPNAHHLMAAIPASIVDGLGCYVVKVELLKEGGKDYIAVHVPKSHTPLRWKGKVYVRIGASNHCIPESEVEPWLAGRERCPAIDSIPVRGLGPDTVDSEALALYREVTARTGKDAAVAMLGDGELLEYLGLVRDGSLTTAGVVLFHPEPSAYLPGARFDCQYTDRLGGFSREICEGPMFPSLVRLKGQFCGGVASKILFEGLVNAVVHNLYSSPDPIRLRIEEGRRIELVNSARRAADWRLEGARTQRVDNPLVVNALIRAGLCESLGKGLQRVKSWSEANGDFSFGCAFVGSDFHFVVKARTAGGGAMVRENTTRLPEVSAAV